VADMRCDRFLENSRVPSTDVDVLMAFIEGKYLDPHDTDIYKEKLVRRYRAIEAYCQKFLSATVLTAAYELFGKNK
jgi:hypothetical protein